MPQQSRPETRTSEPDFTDTTAPLTLDRERARARTLARALTQAHLTLTDVVTVIEHATSEDHNPIPDRCAAWRMECTADGHPLTIRYDWLTPIPHTPWTVTVHGTTHQLPERKGRYFTGTARHLTEDVRRLVRTDPTPDGVRFRHGQTTRCSACHAPITWYLDDPDARTLYGLWVDAADRDLCPATGENASNQFHNPQAP
ncbi:hypothetical protein ACPXCO_24210 [Streptomyces cyaneofuscatus]|uniref:hypothetical protein n=1 Tax=Streptomyces cyaneofuscatus TaxID=66883 RepID=UPI003CF82B06